MEQKQKRPYRKAGPFHVEFRGLQACLRRDKSQVNIKTIVDLWWLIRKDRQFNKALFDLLDEQERDFMRYCLNKCKITSRGFKSAYNQLLDGLVKRLKVLEGANRIGDDNPSIKIEMKSILDKLYQKNVFSTSYYSQFKRLNSFKIIWPTASTTSTYTITLPDGAYSASDINNYLQYWSIQNNLYLTNNTTGSNYYFISCAENPSSYAIQFTMQPVKNTTGYTAASGFPTMPVSAYTPQLQVVDSSFGSIIGFSPATYPADQTTNVYAVYSNLVPQIDPTAAVVITCSNLYNPIANNNQVLHTFTSAGVEYGGLITTAQGQGLAYCPMQGTNSELTLSFLDQNMIPLGIIDNNVCIRLLIRPKKSSSE
ncbi:hypothetical protein AM588_10000649 [Phytophthora nicotianae]|uniref:Uncharacterized protein n=1 Tax=Phytophthora nicotianae TaxID=4792 RepID=A0A0W8CJQ4_PHYNI|nr:hypothetical protein AM588_10000649 [Phytophthora nicotianae]